MLFNCGLAQLCLAIINLHLSLTFKHIRPENALKKMKPNTTSKNNQDINTTTKALINHKC